MLYSNICFEPGYNSADMKIRSTSNGEHYTWGEACSGWHLLKSPGLSVIQEQAPAGAGEIRHYHERAEQFFYVLSGKASLEVEGKEHVLQAGQGLHVAAGKAHRLSNSHSQALDFLVISTPPSHGDRIDLEDRAD